MPKITSAKKALRQNKKRRVINLAIRRGVKQTVKEFDGLVVSGNLEEAKNKLPVVFKTLDKAAKTGVIEKNKSSRLKSRLSLRLNKASKSGSES